MKRVVIAITSVVAILVTIYLVILWGGFLDTGTFEIVQNQTSSKGKIAILAKRSSVQALSGNTYFVIISDHLNSPAELRKTLHSSLPVFIADRDGISLQWTSPNELTIRCERCGITHERIEVLKSAYADSAIRYSGFP